MIKSDRGSAIRRLALVLLLAGGAWAAPASAAPYSSHGQLYTCCTDSAVKEAMFAEAAQSGAALIRVDVAMDTVMPEFAGEGARDWRGLDEVAVLSARHGLPVLAVLHGTPRQLTACEEPWERRRLCPPADAAVWGALAGEIAERYAGRIGHVQIWNEPDAQWAFLGGPADYARLLVGSWREIKQRAPGTQVVLGGLMDSHAGGRAWLEEVFQADPQAVQSFDVAALHLRGPGAELTPQIPEMAAYLGSRGRQVPLWVTEHGYPSDPRWQNDPRHTGGEPSQAAYLAETLPALAVAGAQQVFVTLHDGGGGAFDSEGILEGNGRAGGSFRRKAAWYAFRDAVQDWPRVLALLNTPPPSPPRPKAGACANRRLGGHGRDVLRGTRAGDDLLALRGNDLIRSAAGEDCLSGGAGRDRLEGGTHRDRLYGGPGNDRLLGGDGADRLVGNAGLDLVDGGAGADVIDSADGTRERVRCGPGRDRVTADAADVLLGCERVRRRR